MVCGALGKLSGGNRCSSTLFPESLRWRGDDFVRLCESIELPDPQSIFCQVITSGLSTIRPEPAR